MIGERIKELRTKKRWTITDLSQRSGLSLAMISSLENGTRNASKKTIKILADLFKVSEEWLSTGEDKGSVIQDFVKRLVDEKIITSPDDIPEDVQKMILKTIEAEIALLLMKKDK